MNQENTYNQPLPFFLQALIQLLQLLANFLSLEGSGQAAAAREILPSSPSFSAGPGSRLQQPEEIIAPEQEEEGSLSPKGMKTGKTAPSNITEPAVKNDHTIYRRVDVPPLFLHYEWLSEDMYCEPLAHTSRALTYFVTQTRQYPEIARRVGAKGVVVVHFVVEKDGAVSRIEARSRLGFGCRREAVRIFEKMNELGLRWEAARIDGRPVRKACRWVVTFAPGD